MQLNEHNVSELITQICSSTQNNAERRVQLMALKYKILALPEVKIKAVTKQLNDFLNRAAVNQENELAELLIELGADLNHYGQAILVPHHSLLCNFPEMLLLYGNDALLEKILFNIDLRMFSVSDDDATNVSNPYINTDPIYTVRMHNELKNAKKRDETDKEFEAKRKPLELFNAKIRTKLMFVAMMCNWAIQHGKISFLNSLACYGRQFTAEDNSTRFTAVVNNAARFFTEQINNSHFCKQHGTSKQMVRLFQAAHINKPSAIEANVQMLLYSLMLPGSILFNLNNYNLHDNYHTFLSTAIAALQAKRMQQTWAAYSIGLQATRAKQLENAARAYGFVFFILYIIVVFGKPGGMITITAAVAMIMSITIPATLATPYLALGATGALTCGALIDAKATPAELALQIMIHGLLSDLSNRRFDVQDDAAPLPERRSKCRELFFRSWQTRAQNFAANVDRNTADRRQYYGHGLQIV